MKKHYPEIDKLRGMAILMVLLYHSVIVYPLDLHEVYWCKMLHEFLWYMEMPLFFIVSGFCFSYQTGTYKQYLLKKAKRLMIPYFAFGILELIPRTIPNPLVNEQMPAGQAVAELLLYGGNNWFLWTLFLLFILFPALHILYRKGPAGQFAVLAGSVLLYGISNRLTNLFLIQMTAWFLVYFTAGYVLRQTDYDRCLQVLAGRFWILTAVIGFGIMSAAFWYQTQAENGRLLILAGTLGGTVFFWTAAVKLKGLAERFLLLCGTWSLQMYLLGGYALVATRTLLVGLLGIHMPVMIILGNFVLDSIITLWVSRYILKRYKLLRILSGQA